MRRSSLALGLAGALLVVAWGAVAQVGSLWLREAPHEGTIYVFNTPDAYRAWQDTHALPGGISKPGYGPKGETVVFENQAAIALYDLKHGRESELPPLAPAAAAPTSAPPPLPTSLKIGEGGELRISSLLQAWYIWDDSLPGTGLSPFGNTTGKNTFRIRRAELRLRGTVSPAWGFEVMADAAKAQDPLGDDRILQELAISFLGLKGHELSIGQKKIPLTDESLRSSTDLDFADRAQMTRALSDVRQAGVFYRGAVGRRVTASASVTNGVLSNTNSDTNDTVLVTGMLDTRPLDGLVVGASGSTGRVNGGTGHRPRHRIGAHARYDGPDAFPVLLRAEYLSASDELAGGRTLRREGWYASLLLRFAGKLRAGVRWDELDLDTDTPGTSSRILTGSLQWFPVGKYANFKLEVHNVRQDGRVVGTVPEPEYNLLLLAAQASF